MRVWRVFLVATLALLSFPGILWAGLDSVSGLVAVEARVNDLPSYSWSTDSFPYASTPAYDLADIMLTVDALLPPDGQAHVVGHAVTTTARTGSDLTEIKGVLTGSSSLAVDGPEAIGEVTNTVIFSFVLDQAWNYDLDAAILLDSSPNVVFNQSLFSFAGPGVSVVETGSTTVDLSGTLAPGAYSLTAAYAFIHTISGGPLSEIATLEANFQLLLSVPESSTALLVGGGLLVLLGVGRRRRRRTRLAAK